MKIQLTITINFISSKDDNIEIMIIDDADEFMEELFKWRVNKYKNDLEK